MIVADPASGFDLQHKTPLQTLHEGEPLPCPPSAASSARKGSLAVKFACHSSDDSERLRALKTGYLIKRPSIRTHGNKIKFWAGGKQKFFVLRGGSLTYHKDHRTVDDAAQSTEIILTADCDVEYFYDPPHANFGFCVTSKGKVLQLVAKDVMERQEWKDAICMVINQIKCTTRGYLLKRCAGAPYTAHSVSAPYPTTADSYTHSSSSGSSSSGSSSSSGGGTHSSSSSSGLGLSAVLGSTIGGGGSSSSSSSSGGSLIADEEALWTRRFFILSGSERRLTFHADHSHALVVQGCFSLSAETTVEKKPHNVVALKDADTCLVWRAGNAQDCQMWVSALSGVITDAKKALAQQRASAATAAAGNGSDTTSATTAGNGSASPRSSAKLAKRSDTEGELMAQLHVHVSADVSTVVTPFPTPAGETERARGYLLTRTVTDHARPSRVRPDNSSNVNGSSAAAGADAAAAAAAAGATAGGDGDGSSRGNGGNSSVAVIGGGGVPGELWLPNYYVLTDAALYRLEDEHFVAPAVRLALTPSCSVFATNLRPHSFELVTANRVLHVQGIGHESASCWIAALKAAINASEPDGEDPLLAEAAKLEDEFYEVTFETKQPLGVVLERSKEWAVVKLANPSLSAVTVGSALAAVNGKSVVLKPYHTTIALLTGWKPPLHLVFRRAPEKSGWLKKQKTSAKGGTNGGGLLNGGLANLTGGSSSTSSGTNSSMSSSSGISSSSSGSGMTAVGAPGGGLRGIKKWKPVYFILAEGKLSWFNSDGPTAKLQGVVPMMGSAVSLMPFTEAGQHFCLSMVSGITTLVLQGLTAEDMLDWSTHLYHASAIANGGGYLLDKEKSREKAFEEERARRAQARAAELEAAERRQVEAAAAAQAAFNTQPTAAGADGSTATTAASTAGAAAGGTEAGSAADGSTANSDAPQGKNVPRQQQQLHPAVRPNSNKLALVCLELAHRERKAAEIAAEQAATAVCELEYAREQEAAAAAAAAKEARERRRLTALEVDAALKDLLARQAVASARSTVLQQIAVADSSSSSSSSGSAAFSSLSSKGKGKGMLSRCSFDGLHSASAAAAAAAEGSSSADAAQDGGFISTSTAAGAAATAGAFKKQSRRTQSMDLAKMLSGSWDPVVSGAAAAAGTAPDQTDTTLAEDVDTSAGAEAAAAATASDNAADDAALESTQMSAVTTKEGDTDVAVVGAAVAAPDAAAPTTAAASAGADDDDDVITPLQRKRSVQHTAGSSNGPYTGPITPSRNLGPSVMQLVQARSAASAAAAAAAAAGTNAGASANKPTVAQRLAATAESNGARGPSWQRRRSSSNTPASMAAAAAASKAAQSPRAGTTVQESSSDAAQQHCFQELAQWISAVTQEPFGANAGATGAVTAAAAPAAVTAAAFAQALQDGRMLLLLLLALGAPGTAPPSSSPLQYKKLDNIARFLRGARALGVPAELMFAPAELYEQRGGSGAAAARVLRALVRVLPAALPSYTGPLLELPDVEGDVVSDTVQFGESPATVQEGSDDEQRCSSADTAAASTAAATAAAGSSSAPGKGGSKASAGSAPGVAVQSSSASGEVLTDATLEQAFASLDITAQTGRLNAMQFSSLWRVLTGEQNLFREMAVFNKFSSSSVICLEEFKAGFRVLEQELGADSAIFDSLRAWTDSQAVAF